MATTTAPLTIDDFERLPDEEVKNRELVDGVLVDVSGNTLIHNIIRGVVFTFFRDWAAKNGGCAVTEQEYDFAGNVHGPDVTYFGPAKVALAEKRKRVQR